MNLAMAVLIASLYIVGCGSEAPRDSTLSSNPDKATEDYDAPLGEDYSTSADANSEAYAFEEIPVDTINMIPFRRAADARFSEHEKRVWEFLEFLRVMPHETAREVIITLDQVRNGSMGSERCNWDYYSVSSLSTDDGGWHVLDEYYRIDFEFKDLEVSALLLMDIRDGYSVRAEHDLETSGDVLGKATLLHRLYKTADFVRHMPDDLYHTLKNEVFLSAKTEKQRVDSLFEFDYEMFYQSSGLPSYYTLGCGYNMIILYAGYGVADHLVLSKGYTRESTIHVHVENIPYIGSLLERGCRDISKPLLDYEGFKLLMIELWGELE